MDEMQKSCVKKEIKAEFSPGTLLNRNMDADHVRHSPRLNVSNHRICNPHQDQLKEAKRIKKELLDASDHFPVFLDLDLY